MKIGVDLDHTVYGFPEFFVAFISAMSAAGHKFYCTSNHRRSQWPEDEKRLRKMGIDPSLIDPSLMVESPDGAKEKARMSEMLDINFDDHADHFQHLTTIPVFKCPAEKAAENKKKTVKTAKIDPLEHSLRMLGKPPEIPMM